MTDKDDEIESSDSFSTIVSVIRIASISAFVILGIIGLVMNLSGYDNWQVFAGLAMGSITTFFITYKFII